LAALARSPVRRSRPRLDNRSNDRAEQGARAGAIANFNEVIRLDPRHANTFNSRGVARAGQGERGAATDAVEARRLRPAIADSLTDAFGPGPALP